MKKIKLALVALVATVIITGSSVYASFPVKNETRTEQITNATTPSTTQNAEVKAVEKALTEKVSAKPEKTQMDKEMIITLLLWFFLGGVAAHRWYKKKPVGWNILYIITLGGCGIWAIVDLINILTDNF
jgi:hypothetical protein